jgi:predicted ATPase
VTNRNIQIILESHSEHLLRRLQRRIAEKSLEPKDTALYFCEIDKRGSSVTTLDVDLFGTIRNWPEDFFGDEFGEIAAISRAATHGKREMTE